MTRLTETQTLILSAGSQGLAGRWAGSSAGLGWRRTRSEPITVGADIADRAGAQWVSACDAMRARWRLIWVSDIVQSIGAPDAVDRKLSGAENLSKAIKWLVVGWQVKQNYPKR